MDSNKPHKNLGNLASARAAFALANELQARRMEEGVFADFCYRQDVEGEWDDLVNSASDTSNTATTSSSNKPFA
jgi:hypothetical protein